METFINHLHNSDLLTLREVVRLLLLSALFTLAARWAFPQNAPTRRALLLAALALLVTLPWLLAWGMGVWTVPLAHVPDLTLADGVPNTLVWIWIAVATLLAGRHIVQAACEVRRIHRLPAVCNHRARTQLTQVCQSLDVPVPHLVLGETPCATTLGGPCLVLPPGFQSWDDMTLRAVFAHELVHIQRRDDRWQMLLALLVRVYWWMPWLGALQRRFVHAMEESCDDAASEWVGHKVAYLDALVGVAGRHQGTNRVATFMHAHHLLARVKRFMQPRQVELDVSGVYWCVMPILVLVMLLTSVQPVARPAPEARAVVSASMITNSSSNPDVAGDPGVARFPVIYQQAQLPVSLSAQQRQRLSQPRQHAAAIYPGVAIRRGLQGDVVVEFSVSKDGSVSQARVLTSISRSGTDQILDDGSNATFSASALRAAQALRFPSGYATSGLMPVSARKNAQQQTRIQRRFQYRLESG